jgi:hypothetical protein
MDTSWVKDDSQSALFARAEALGASSFTLSSEIRASTFIKTKDELATGIFTFQILQFNSIKMIKNINFIIIKIN